MTLKDIHKYEIEKVGEIFKKSKISFIPELKISIETNKTDIDILGMSKNILILVECFGTESFGEKLKKTITNLKNIKKNFKKVREIIKQEYPLFYRTHKSFLEGTNLKFRCLLVSSQKETKDCVEDFHKKNYEEEDFFLWTTEELYYYDKVSDCTYDHCKYEIFSCINVFPEDIEDDAESSIPSYIAYGKQIKEGIFLLNLVVPVKILLKRSTIRRLRDSSSIEGYQRLLDKNKLKSMREYLLKEESTYPNNIICVLNKNSKILPLNKVIEEIKLKKEEGARSDNVKDIKNSLFLLDVPNTYDVFEIVDGQHRVFSFAQTRYSSFENIKGESSDEIIAKDNKIEEIANKQTLTVTTIYSEKEELWSNPGKLFLDINTKQTKIKPEDIIDIVEKYDKENNEPVINANFMLKKLNEKGFLRNKIRFKPWQDDRIKRTSLISYSGLKDIFDKKKKTHKIFREIYEKQNKIENYGDFCFILVNNYLKSIGDLIKGKVGNQDFEKIYEDLSLRNYYFLSAVFVGALIRLLRHFICKNKNSKLNLVGNIEESLDKGVDNNDTLNRNIDNKKIQALFSEGLKVIVEKYNFTKEEFSKEEGWGSNKWSKIESDMFYLIRNKKDAKFGDESLISKTHKR